jgi:hypothetical protein
LAELAYVLNSFFVALNSGKRIERSERGQPGEFADLAATSTLEK